MIADLNGLREVIEQTEHKVGLHTVNVIMTKALEQRNFFAQLRDGGRIVSSNSCTPLEIAEARGCHRMIVDDEGFGYIYIKK